MLYPINQDEFDLTKLINSKCGNEYSIIQRVLKNNFGSSRYKLIGITPSVKKIEINNDNIYLNFDLRDRGIVFYFRFKNTEYVEFCPYHFLTLQSNDKSFVLQTDKYKYQLEILNKKTHTKFIYKLYEFKNKSQ